MYADAIEYRERLIRRAKELADELREFADAVEKAAAGDIEAKRKIHNNIDGHWHALVFGTENNIAQEVAEDFGACEVCGSECNPDGCTEDFKHMRGE